MHLSSCDANSEPLVVNQLETPNLAVTRARIHDAATSTRNVLAGYC